jgi:hypothetical protein
MECQILQLQEVGCHRFVASKALAVKVIANEDDIYFSVEEVLEVTSRDNETTAHPHIDRRNLPNCKTMWVGNVTKNAI